VAVSSSSTSNRNELDDRVVNIELTLTSIIQGVALYFLAENARLVLAAGRWPPFLYVGSGLLIILLFWSRSLIHTLTLIRWPLEFVHNFLYFACALCEVLAFTRLADPQGWFTILAVYAAVVWLLFVYDQRLVHLRASDSVGRGGRELFALVERDQLLNIRVIIPVVFVFNAVCAIAIRRAPDLFLIKQGHVLLVVGEALGLLVYLRFVIRSYVKLVPLIAAAHEEWRGGERGRSAE
jgi:hypothetical protein